MSKAINHPPEWGRAYPISPRFPGAKVRWYEDGIMELVDSLNDAHIVGRWDSPDHTFDVLSEGTFVWRPEEAAPDRTVPIQVPPGYNLSAIIKHVHEDHRWHSSRTGDGGRGYISELAPVVLHREAGGWSWADLKNALKALRRWTVDELSLRPWAHAPMAQTSRDGGLDSYSRRHWNYGTERYWTSGRKNSLGANSYDAAHLDYRHAALLASVGDPLGLFFMFLLAYQCVGSEHPGQCSSWMTQPRATWLVDFARRCEELKMLNDGEQGLAMVSTVGRDPSWWQDRWIEHSIAEHWERAGLGDTVNSKQRGFLPFHLGIRAHCLAQSGAWLEARAMVDYLLEVAIQDGSPRMARVVGTTRYETFAEAQAAIDAAGEKNEWEPFYRESESPGGEVPGPGWYTRELPRLPDAEMFWPAYVAVYGWDERAQEWWDQRPQNKFHFDLAAWGLKQSGTPRPDPSDGGTEESVEKSSGE